MSTVTYSVPNISCNHCVHTIQTEIADVDGVKAVVANSGTKMVEITFDAPATEQTLKEALKSINYPVADKNANTPNDSLKLPTAG